MPPCRGRRDARGRAPLSRLAPESAVGQDALVETLERAGIGYRRAVELGGRLSGDPGAELYPCVRVSAFRSYLARMKDPVWQAALGQALAQPAPCLMCAETDWRRCHRRLIADLLTARGNELVHLLRPHQAEQHLLVDVAQAREGKLYVCGQVVA
jgi:uncharacterized protein (DUF488 family)